MTDETSAPAEAGAVEESVSKIWAELQAEELGESLADDGQPAATEPAEEVATEPQDQQTAADATAAPSAQEGQEAATQTTDLQTGQDDANPASETPVDERIEKLEHKVASDQGRIAAHERDGRHHEAAKVRARVQTRLNELAALRKGREDLKVKDDGTQGAEFREEYPQVAQQLEQQRQSQDDALAARENSINEDLGQLFKEQKELLEKKHPDYADVVAKNSADIVEFVNSPGISRAALQGFRENYSAVSNAASAEIFMDAFKEYKAAKAASTTQTTEIPNTGKPADPPSDQSAVTSAPSETVDQTTQVTQPDPDAKRRQKQLDGATSTTGNTHPPMSSMPPADSEDISTHWKYWRDKERQDEAQRG
ncbi:hypothetical protein [Roseibium sp.]|uniref:hypothetical protein n=1 Tax=Roseibium sp. TaxID=1936156 RepID=UPI003B52EB7A